MNRRLAALALLCWIIFGAGLARGGDPGASSTAFRDEDRPPNVVLIMADDLGFGDLGCYGQRIIQTPHIDRIAEEGVRFTQFYSGFPVCAPARCSLLTGMHAGHCEIRNNGNPPGRQRDDERSLFPGQNPIPDELITLAELFRDRGYATGAMGKWGLGFEGSSGDPNRQGFDLFFGFLCQVHAHNHYPRFLWRNDRQIVLEGNDRTLEGAAYSQDLFIDEAVAFIERNVETPFFLYLPFAVPHLSIQVPGESVEPYRDRIVEADHEPGNYYLRHPSPRAGYAGMVTRMDQGVGRVLQTLQESGLDDRTIVLFTSDNGPAFNRLGGTDSAYFQSSGGLRGLKGSVYEGGIRVPLVVRWLGRTPEGTVSDLPAYFADMLPTLLELIEAPEAIPNDVDGLSLAPTILGRPQDHQPTHDYLYWEFPGYGGQQAIRQGDWKAVRQQLRRGTIQSELYDLNDDPSESNDLAEDRPEIVERLEALMSEAHTPSDRFPLPSIDTQVDLRGARR